MREGIGGVLLRHREFDEGLLLECRGERFTPRQRDGAQQVELLLRRVRAARRAHADDSGEHAKRAQRYRHGYLPKLLLGRPVRAVGRQCNYSSAIMLAAQKKPTRTSGKKNVTKRWSICA